MLTGLSALYANEMKKIVQPLFNKAFHTIWGLLVYTLAMSSIYTSFDTDIFFEHSLDASTYKDFNWLIKGAVATIWLLTM